MNATPSLLDQLAALLDDVETDTKPTALATHPPAPPPIITKPTEYPTPAPRAVSGPVAPPSNGVGALTPAQASERREALRDAAYATMTAALRVVKANFEAGSADYDDAIKAIPVASRIFEHLEKMDAAREGGGQQPPPMSFRIILDPNIPQTPPPGRASPLAPRADVIDVDESGKPIDRGNPRN